MKRIDVFYHDHLVGQLAAAGRKTSFQFAPDFVQRGIQLSPLTMKLRPEPYIYSDAEFDFLPPLLSDSLPDSYGRSIMTRWFAQKFGAEFRPSVLDKLAYVGEGAIGALCFRPSLEAFPAEFLRELDLRQEQKLATGFAGRDSLGTLEKLRRAAHTVGGRFPKALVAIDPKTNVLYEDDPRLPPQFERWIVKFGIPPQERDSLINYPEMEYAYSCMARDAGISIGRTRLLTSSGDRGDLTHFAIERFDIVSGTRMHVGSLSALTGIPASRLELDYRDLLSTTLALSKDLREVRQAFVRMVFNVLLHNVDDHGKNHAFVFDGNGWKLSPAFDLTFSDVSAPGEYTVASRAMPVGGNPLNPRRKDFLRLGERSGLSVSDCSSILDQVAGIAENAGVYLEQAGVEKSHALAAVSAVNGSLRDALRE